MNCRILMKKRKIKKIKMEKRILGKTEKKKK